MLYNMAMSEDRELQTLIREIHGTMRVLDERTQSMLKQVEKTNGRVTRLEDNVDVINKVQEGLAVKVGAIVTVAATAITTMLSKVIS